jgi:hypothetical protein
MDKTTSPPQVKLSLLLRKILFKNLREGHKSCSVEIKNRKVPQLAKKKQPKKVKLENTLEVS